MPATVALSAVIILLMLVALTPPAQGDELPNTRQLCASWAAQYSYPSGIAQERCRSSYPELALDYGAYCTRLNKSGKGTYLEFAACRMHDAPRGEPT